MALVTASLGARENFSRFGHNTRPRGFVLVGFFLKKDSIHNLTSAASYLRQAKWSSFFSSLFSHLSVLFGQKCDRYFCSGANVCVFRLVGKINAMDLFHDYRSYDFGE